MRRTMNKDGLTEKEFLERYNPGDYDRPSVTADILLFTVDPMLNNLKVLLIKRADHPYIDCWAVPGGFVNINESTFTAANRELYEETGLKDIYLEQLYTYSNPERDPRMRVITVAYMGIVPMTKAVAGDDASDTAWFDVILNDDSLVLQNDEKNVTIRYALYDRLFTCGQIEYSNCVADIMTEDRLAFDHQLEVIDGIQRLRNKVEYTDVAFNFLPKEFTLPDLQRVYELILGHPLFKKNFRDKIQEKTRVLDKEEKSIVGNRLSSLFTYRRTER